MAANASTFSAPADHSTVPVGRTPAEGATSVWWESLGQLTPQAFAHNLQLDRLNVSGAREILADLIFACGKTADERRYQPRLEIDPAFPGRAANALFGGFPGQSVNHISIQISVP